MLLVLITILALGLSGCASQSSKLEAAVEAGDSGRVERLLAAGANPSVGLDEAAWSGKSEIVAILLGAGGNPNATRSTYKGRLSLTPLHRAASNGHLGAVKLLVEAGADIKAKARYKSPGLLEFFSILLAFPILSVLTFGSGDIEKFLGTEMADMDGWTPVQFAEAGRHNKVVRFLTEASSVR